MPEAKKPKYVFDGVRGDRYVRAWKEGRGKAQEIIVQVWNKTTPEGEPDGDWGMPAFLGPVACMEQAMVQTPKSS